MDKIAHIKEFINRNYNDKDVINSQQANVGWDGETCRYGIKQAYQETACNVYGQCRPWKMWQLRWRKVVDYDL